MGKQVAGRKRHIVVDTMGSLLAAVVQSASARDRDGVKLVTAGLRARFRRVKLVWADGAYEAAVVWAKRFGRLVPELVRRPSGRKGFIPLPRRRVVERTFARMVQCRRLTRDYERLTPSPEAMVHVAMMRLMPKRIRTA